MFFMKKVEKSQKKRVKKEGHSYISFPQKYECHSLNTPKKEWQSSFAPNFGNGAQKSAAL